MVVYLIRSIAARYHPEYPLTVLQKLGDNVIPYLSVGPLNEVMTQTDIGVTPQGPTPVGVNAGDLVTANFIQINHFGITINSSGAHWMEFRAGF